MLSFNRLPLYQGGKNLQGIQILKFICAIFVVQLHAQSAIRPYLAPIARMAVPVFLIISGYFLVSADGTISLQKIKSTFVKILKIYLFAVSVYLIIKILLTVLNGNPLTFMTNLRYWGVEILFGSSVGYHLWYLTAYMQTLIALYLLQKIKLRISLPLIIFIGLAINLALGCYGFLFFSNDIAGVLNRNVFTIGIPCVAIGILIRINEARLPNQKIVLMALIASIVLLYVEDSVIHHSLGNIIIMTVPVGALSFISFLNFNNSLRFWGIIADLGKKYSLDIYLWHPIVIIIWGSIRKHLGLGNGADALFVIILTLGLSMLLTPSQLPDKCHYYLKSKLSKVNL